MHRLDEIPFLSINKEIEEEGTALQKLRQIHIRSLVLVHLNTKLNQSSAEQGRVHPHKNVHFGSNCLPVQMFKAPVALNEGELILEWMDECWQIHTSTPEEMTST